MKRPCRLFSILGILFASAFNLNAFAQADSNTENTSNDTTPAVTATGQSPLSVTIATAQGNVGEFLADSQGKSLYIFESDAPKQSNCTGVCAQVWIPFVVSRGQTASVSGHADSALVGTIQRVDGLMQVTYKDMPLYTYKMDQSSGDTKGQGLNDQGGNWFLVKPDGTQLKPQVATPSSGTGSSALSEEGSGSNDALNFLTTDLRDNVDRNDGHHDGGHHDGDHHDGGGHHDGGYHDCYYWGTCYNNTNYNNCGYYSCYYNGYCCNYCGSCYYNG